jgi:hypothetical protein
LSNAGRVTPSFFYCRRSLATVGIFMLFFYWWPAATRFAAERGLELVRIVAWPEMRSRGYTERFVTHFEETVPSAKARDQGGDTTRVAPGTSVREVADARCAEGRNRPNVRYAKRLLDALLMHAENVGMPN